MNYLFLIPIALGMGAVGLAAFLWSLKSGQYDDLEGAAERILPTDSSDRPLNTTDRAGLTGRTFESPT